MKINNYGRKITEIYNNIEWKVKLLQRISSNALCCLSTVSGLIS
jgi:hypothetical protein